MFNKLKNMFLMPQDSGKSGSETNAQKRIQVATAVILLEVANADEDFSESEQESIFLILKNLFQLDDENIQDLLEISREERDGSVDLWHFTNIINENYTDEEKYRVIENVWKVIYADGRLDKYEDQIVHKLARILHIPHNRMIEAKLQHLPEDG